MHDIILRNTKKRKILPCTYRYAVRYQYQYSYVPGTSTRVQGKYVNTRERFKNWVLVMRPGRSPDVSGLSEQSVVTGAGTSTGWHKGFLSYQVLLL